MNRAIIIFLLFVTSVAFGQSKQFFHLSTDDTTKFSITNGTFWRSPNNGKFYWMENNSIKALGISSGGGGGSVNFANNGTSLSGDTVQLGGSLTKNTFIEGYKKLDFGDNLPLNQFQVTTGRNDFSTQSFLTIYSDSASGTTNNYFELSSYYGNKHAGILAHVSSSADQLEIQQQGNGFINLSTGLSGGSLIERFSADSIGNIKILPNGTTGSNGQFLRTDGTGKSSWNGIYFKNGLTKQSDSTTVKLGGLLTNNTTINMNGYNLNINSGNVISTGAFWGLGISPSYRLDVNGTTNSAIYRADNFVLNDTTSNILTWNSTSGNFQRRRASSLGGGSPAGSNTQIQYNNSGSFGASANLTYDGSSLGLFNSKFFHIDSASVTKMLINPTNITIGSIISGSDGYLNISNSHSHNQITLDKNGLLVSNGGHNDDFTIQGANGNNTSAPALKLFAGDGTGAAGNGGNVVISSGNLSGTGHNGYIILQNVPTSSAGLPSGAIWSNSGVLTIVP